MSIQCLGTGRRNKCLLLKTGQVTQYGGNPDDGYYQKGVLKAYTALTAGQYSGSTNITLNGKTDAHSNNCVFDHNTGLMWSRYVSASVGAASDGKLPWTTNVDGEGIFAYCAAANAASLAGHTDWRIPNIYELMSLWDYEQPTSLPDAAAFPSFFSGWVYTSTTRTPGTTSAYVSNSYAGTVDIGLKTAVYPCILVRG